MGRVWRRAKRPATGRRKKPKQQAWGAIDLGSHSLRVAYTPKPGAPPEVLQLGVKSDPDGAEVPSFACPTNVYFPPESVTKEPEWKLLWYDSVKYPGRTSPGVKQSLDDRLSQPGTQGAHFRDLAAKDPNVSWDVVLELFKFVKRHIDERQIKLDRVNITVPAIQTRGSDGYEIQKTLRVYARSAGFSNVDFDSEPGAIAAWLAWKETSHGDASRWVVIADFGSGTSDIGHYLLRKGRGHLITRPGGRGGGIDDVKELLRIKCEKLDPGNTSLLNQAEEHLFKLTLQPEDFTYGKHTIPVDEFYDMIRRSYVGALEILEQQVRDASQLDEVIVSGGTPASNKWWRGQITECLGTLNEGRESKFDVRFLTSEEAKFAVCKGASIQYSLDPVPEFNARPFGILFHDDKLRDCVLELKAAGSKEPLEDQLGVRVAKGRQKRQKFLVQPHMIMDGAQPIGEFQGFTLYSQDDARPMRRQVFDLSQRQLEGGSVWLRFIRNRKDPTRFILEIDCDDGKEPENGHLRLDVDRDGPFLRRIEENGHDLAQSDIDEETDEEEEREEKTDGIVAPHHSAESGSEKHKKGQMYNGQPEQRGRLPRGQQAVPSHARMTRSGAHSRNPEGNHPDSDGGMPRTNDDAPRSDTGPREGHGDGAGAGADGNAAQAIGAAVDLAMGRTDQGQTEKEIPESPQPQSQSQPIGSGQKAPDYVEDAESDGGETNENVQEDTTYTVGDRRRTRSSRLGASDNEVEEGSSRMAGPREKPGPQSGARPGQDPTEQLDGTTTQLEKDQPDSGPVTNAEQSPQNPSRGGKRQNRDSPQNRNNAGSRSDHDQSPSAKRPKLRGHGPRSPDKQDMEGGIWEVPLDDTGQPSLPQRLFRMVGKSWNGVAQSNSAQTVVSASKGTDGLCKDTANSTNGPDGASELVPLGEAQPGGHKIQFPALRSPPNPRGEQPLPGIGSIWTTANSE